MPKSAKHIKQEVQELLEGWRLAPAKRGGDSDVKDLFRVELSEGGRRSLAFQRKDYKTALRAASAELLGSGGDLAKIFWKDTLVAEGYLQSRRVRGGGLKRSVLFVGEKLLK